MEYIPSCLGSTANKKGGDIRQATVLVRDKSPPWSGVGVRPWSLLHIRRQMYDRKGSIEALGLGSRRHACTDHWVISPYSSRIVEAARFVCIPLKHPIATKEVSIVVL